MDFTITKQVAKHGSQSIIILPKFLENDIKPSDIVEIKIKVVKRGQNG
jgi:hypothetical protein